MKRIDRYIGRLYLINVVTMLVLLAGFVVTVDVFVNLARFSNVAQETAFEQTQEETSGVALAMRTVLIIADYWGPKLLQLFNYLLGVVLVAGMGFTCAQLTRQREFVALLASGIPLQRLALPFIAVALGLTALQAINQEFVVPKLAPLLVREVGDAGSRETEAFAISLVPDDEGRLLRARKFDPEKSEIEGLEVYERNENAVVTRVIRADRGVWDGTGWVLENGRVSNLQTGVRGRGVDRVDTPLDPTRLKVRLLRGYGESLGWRQVGAIIDAGGMGESAAKRLDQMRWGRIATMASNLVVLIAALPFFLRKLPGPMIAAGLKAAPIGLLGLVAAGAAASLPIGGLPVWIGVFLPTVVLLPLAVALFSGVKT